MPPSKSGALTRTFEPVIPSLSSGQNDFLDTPDFSSTALPPGIYLGGFLASVKSLFQGYLNRTNSPYPHCPVFIPKAPIPPTTFSMFLALVSHKPYQNKNSM